MRASVESRSEVRDVERANVRTENMLAIDAARVANEPHPVDPTMRMMADSSAGGGSGGARRSRSADPLVADDLTDDLDASARGGGDDDGDDVDAWCGGAGDRRSRAGGARSRASSAARSYVELGDTGAPFEVAGVGESKGGDDGDGGVRRPSGGDAGDGNAAAAPFDASLLMHGLRALDVLEQQQQQQQRPRDATLTSPSSPVSLLLLGDDDARRRGAIAEVWGAVGRWGGRAGTLSSSRPLILFSSHPLILFSSHPLFLSSSLPLILSSSRPLFLSSSHPLIVSSSHRLILSPLMLSSEVQVEVQR